MLPICEIANKTAFYKTGMNYECEVGSMIWNSNHRPPLKYKSTQPQLREIEKEGGDMYGYQKKNPLPGIEPVPYA